MSENVLWVNTQLKGSRIQEFFDLKQYLGIETNSDVVRFLIRQAATAKERAPTLLVDPGVPYETAPEASS